MLIVSSWLDSSGLLVRHGARERDESRAVGRRIQAPSRRRGRTGSGLRRRESRLSAHV